MSLLSEPLNVLIVAGDAYRNVSDELVQGAIEALDSLKINHALVRVSGALEIPFVIAGAERAAHRPAGRRYDGFVALGVVIKGETSNYDIVARESSRAIMQMTIDGFAIGNGIIVAENEEQAMARASRTDRNKGKDAAIACATMIEVWKKLNMGGI